MYRARDPSLGREVAIKVLPDAMARDAERLERFEREARALSSLSRPHIVTIFAVESASESRFFVMELIESGTLEQLLRSGALGREAVRELPEQAIALHREMGLERHAKWAEEMLAEV